MSKTGHYPQNNVNTSNGCEKSALAYFFSCFSLFFLQNQYASPNVWWYMVQIWERYICLYLHVPHQIWGYNTICQDDDDDIKISGLFLVLMKLVLEPKFYVVYKQTRTCIDVSRNKTAPMGPWRYTFYRGNPRSTFSVLEIRLIILDLNWVV